jgi:hypothetical protein
MADLSPEQFAAGVLQGLGIKANRSNVQALVGWTRAEGGHWHNQAKYNPLNTTQHMAGSSTFRSVGQGASDIRIYKSWQQGIQATVDTLKNGRYTGIIQALKGSNPMAVAQAIGASPWGTNGTLAAKTIAGAKGAKVAQLATGSAAGSTTTTSTTPSQTVTSPTFDSASYEDATRKAILGRLLLSQGQNVHNNPLFSSGVLDAAGGNPNPADFAGSQTQTIPGKTVTSSVMRSTPTPTPTAAGTFKVAPGAMRPGTNLASVAKSFFSDVAGHAGHPITVTTGTNHDRLTVNGNVSDHFDGHAGDFGVAVDSHEGDTLAAHALVAAGLGWQQAWHMARQGGLYTIVPTKGRFKGHRIQVIWKTYEGGNHHNHVHIGIR